LTTGFKDKDGKFRPTEKMKVSPQLEKFRRELDIKQLPDSEISKGLEKAEEFSLTPEFVTRLKKEKQKRLQTEIDEKKEIESAKKEIIPSAIFFNEGDIESVDYEFTKDGRIFYPRGFEKEILLEFNAKKLNEKEIEDLFKKVKSEKLPQTDATNTDEFLQENLTENTQFTDTILDHDFEFGSVTTDEDTDDERQYFIIRERDTNIYDVTDLKGESVGGTGEPFGQIREFIFPQASFLFIAFCCSLDCAIIYQPHSQKISLPLFLSSLESHLTQYLFLILCFSEVHLPVYLNLDQTQYQLYHLHNRTRNLVLEI